MAYYGILTGSNPKKDLKHLDKEFFDIKASFSRLQDTVNLVSDKNANEDSIFNTFLAEIDIRIFHFSGHAGDGQLLMGDGQLARGNIMAAMIRYAKNLKLVFLNGCATYDLVDKFLQYGAGVVIATRTPVFDSVASKFSTAFYEHLTRGDSITSAFDQAKRDLKETLAQRISDLSKSKDAEDKTYAEALIKFEKAETPRAIVKQVDAGGDFAWGIYSKEQRNEQWKCIVPGITAAIEHETPGFDFLRKLAEAAISTKANYQAQDPRYTGISVIEENLNGAEFWSKDETSKLIAELKNFVFIPLRDPFVRLVNFCREMRDTKDSTALKTLLHHQLDLYNAFIRTATAIMISDLLECLIRVYQIEGGDKTDDGIFKRDIFKQALKKHPNLVKQFNGLFDGSKDLCDIEFNINMMRNISLCLSDARSASELHKDCFNQFVTEYNANISPSEVNRASIDLIHSIFITVDKTIKERLIEQLTPESLQSYCDRAEDALIKLFEINKYLLAYEIITIGRVEAVRPRFKMPETVCHELITTLLVAPTIITYGEPFAENYSVVLVSNKKHLKNYLCLSPFVINVATFFEEDSCILFFLNGRSAAALEYIEFDNNKITDLTMKISLAPIVNVNSLLEPNTTIQTVRKNRDLKYKIRAHEKFFKVREQYSYMEEKMKDLIKQ